MTRNIVLLLSSVFVFSFAHAQVNPDLPDLKSSEKFNIESSMNILKDAENQHITIQNLTNFLNTYEASQDVKQLVGSYVDQGLSFSDFKKMDYGVYFLKKVASTYPIWHDNMKCYQGTIGPDHCVSQQNIKCEEVSSTGCF